MIKFYEDEHKYIDQTEQTWQGVTTWLKQFEPVKDWDKIAEKKAKKLKVSKQQILDEWQKENELAIIQGNMFHKERQIAVTGLESQNNLKIHVSNFGEDGKVYKFTNDFKLVPGIYCEHLVGLNSKKICGQPDYFEITTDWVLNLYDYKTVKEIKIDGHLNWDGTEEKLLQPFGSLPNTNYWKYALQINTYAYMIKRNNPKITLGKLAILHAIFKDGVHVETKTLEVPDLQHLIKNALK